MSSGALFLAGGAVLVVLAGILQYPGVLRVLARGKSVESLPGSTASIRCGAVVKAGLLSRVVATYPFSRVEVGNSAIQVIVPVAGAFDFPRSGTRVKAVENGSRIVLTSGGISVRLTGPHIRECRAALVSTGWVIGDVDG